MTWTIGLRLWFFVAVALLATAYMLAGKISRLPRVWRGIDVALTGLVAVLSVMSLGASAGVILGIALVVVALAESIGLWLGMGRREVPAWRRVLVVGATLCVLLGALRICLGAVSAATSTDAVSLAELLREGIWNPLLIFVGAVALGFGSRVPGPAAVEASSR